MQRFHVDRGSRCIGLCIVAKNPGCSLTGAGTHDLPLPLDLSSELEAKYRAHREYWDTKEEALLDEEDEPEDTDLDHVIPALRIAFEGVYDKEEDEFAAQTYFASPPPEDGASPVRVSRASKREFGFIYLRALRTGARALSLERGSLLDIILRLKDDDRSEMWEQTLGQLEALDPPIDQVPQLKDV